MKQILFLSIFLCLLAPGFLYAEEDLSHYGKDWEKIKEQRAAEDARHERKLADIEANSSSASERNQRIAEEKSRHKTTDKALARKREEIHEAVRTEVNRRQNKEDLEFTAGKRASDEKFRGMDADSDLGGTDKAARTTKEVMDDMGIKVKFKETPNTIEFGDDFELTINKQDPLGTTGSSSRQHEIAVKAKSAETYVSAGMGDKQPAKNHVETLDNAKKARHGAYQDDPQLMAKGTTKAMKSGQVKDQDLTEIINKNKLNETPETFREKLDKMYEGATPEELGLSKADMEKMKGACMDTLDKATERSGRMAKTELDTAEHKLRALENSNDPAKRAEGKKLREELADSRERIKATEDVNESLKKSPPEPEMDINKVQKEQEAFTKEQKEKRRAENAENEAKTQKKNQNEPETKKQPKNEPETVEKPKKTTENAPDTPEKTSETREKTQKTPETDVPDTQKGPTDTPDSTTKPTEPEVDVPDTQKRPSDVPEPATKPEVDVPDTQKGPSDVPEHTKSTVDGPDAPTKPGVGGQVMGGVDAAGNVIDAIDKTTTYVEGAQEGDPAKMSSTIVGQDTAERVRMKNTEQWAEDEGTVEKARGDEVRQELKAKLRRKGASDAEAEEAMTLRDKGDNKGYKQAVDTIKERGIEDTENRPLTLDGPLQEEDGAGERLKEGAKQAGSYIDTAYGGMIQRTKASVKERDQLNKEHDTTIDSMKDEVDTELVKKMMRKGIPYTEAKEAINAKNEGDSSKYNELRERMHQEQTEDTDRAKHGLDATGRTTSYEGGDYVEDAADNIKTGAENTGGVILKPVKMFEEYQDKKHLETSEEMVNESKYYGKLRSHGATPPEARKAARAYAEGDPEPLIELSKKLKERKAQKPPPEEKEAIRVTDDLFGEKPDDTENEENTDSDYSADDLRNNEGQNPIESDEDIDLDEYADMQDSLDDLIKEMEDAVFGTTEESMKLNEDQEDMRNASVSEDGRIADANEQVNSAVDDASATLGEARNEIVSQDRMDSWGNAIGEGLTEGINSGAAAIGAAIAVGVKNGVFDDRDSSSCSENSSTAGATVSEDTSVASDSQATSDIDKKTATPGSKTKTTGTSKKSTPKKPKSETKSKKSTPKKPKPKIKKGVHTISGGV